LLPRRFKLHDPFPFFNDKSPSVSGFTDGVVAPLTRRLLSISFSRALRGFAVDAQMLLLSMRSSFRPKPRS